MDSLVQRYENTVLKPASEVPEIRPGDTVRVHVNYFEGGLDHVPLKKIHRIAAKGKITRGELKVERVQVFEGTVIAVRNSGSRLKVTVRKVSGGIGVEKSWFVHSRRVNKIEIVRRNVVRRAKLYYMRERTGKATRLREKREFSPKAVNSEAGV